MSITPDHHVLIVGAGFSGIGCSHQARRGGPVRLPAARGRRRSRRNLVLEHLSRYRRGHSVVLLPVLLRAEPGLVAYLCTRARAQGLCRPLRRQVRDPVPHPLQHQGDLGRVRRRARAVAGADRSGRRSHRQVPDQRQRRAHRAQHARHRRGGLVRRHHHAHRALGSQPGPDRQACRDHRHRRLGRAGDPRNRANGRAADRVSAHPDLVLSQVRRPAADRGPLGDANSRRECAFSGCSARPSSR